jgi:hypothetical protein
MDPQLLYAELYRLTQDGDALLNPAWMSRAEHLLELPRYKSETDAAELLLQDIRDVVTAIPNSLVDGEKATEFRDTASILFRLTPGTLTSHGTVIRWLRRAAVTRVLLGLLALQADRDESTGAASTPAIGGDAFDVEELRVVSTRVNLNPRPSLTFIYSIARARNAGPHCLRVQLPYRQSRVFAEIDGRLNRLRPQLVRWGVGNRDDDALVVFDLLPGERMQMWVEHHGRYLGRPDSNVALIPDRQIDRLVLQLGHRVWAFEDPAVGTRYVAPPPKEESSIDVSGKELDN